MALFHNVAFILMLGGLLPVARSSSPFLSADVRQEERDAAENAIRYTADKDDIGDVVAPPPSNRVGPEIMMPPDMGRGGEHKQIQLIQSEGFNPWTDTASRNSDAAYEMKMESRFPDPPSMVVQLAEEAENLKVTNKGQERPDFMSKIFDQDRGGKNFAVAEKHAEDQDARINAEAESLNGDTTMAGMNNAFVAEDKAAKNHDDAFHGGHDASPKMIASDLTNWDSLTSTDGQTSSR